MVNVQSSFTTLAVSFAAITNFGQKYLLSEAFPLSTQTKQSGGLSRAYHYSRINSLNSAVIDEQEQEASSSRDRTRSEKVVARADVCSFYPSPNGKCGIMAIKLREEEYGFDLNPATLNEDARKSSATGLFGGKIAAVSKGNTITSTSKSQQGEDFVGKAVRLSSGRYGTIVAQRPPMAFVHTDFGIWDPSTSEENRIVTVLASRTSVSVSNELFGSILDCYGNFISKKHEKIEPQDSVERALFPPIPKVSQIALINNPLLTGTAMVDVLTPIGKGQNMLLIGEKSGVGQREIAISAIKAQVQSKQVKCVYALTTEDKGERDHVIEQLRHAGVLDDIVVVVARDRPNENNFSCLEAIDACEAISVAACACSIAEALALTRGDDTFVVVDNIDQHKYFWDWTTRVLVDIYGAEAVVKDDKEGGASSEMRGFYSALIQRAAKWNEKNGGGSMTLLLVTNLAGKFGSSEDVEVAFLPEDFAQSSDKVKARIKILTDKNIPLNADTLRKIQIPLPSASEGEKKRRLALQHSDDLISMSDGQIWLEESLYKSGQRPAMDAQKSITRVGVGADTNSRSDAPAFRRLVSGLRFDFAQADALEGAQSNSGAEKLLLKKEAYLLAMHQELGAERSLSENCTVLLAANMRKLDKVVQDGGKAGTKLGKETIEGLLDYVRKSAPSELAEIDSSLDISLDNRKKLEEVVEHYFS